MTFLTYQPAAAGGGGGGARGCATPDENFDNNLPPLATDIPNDFLA